MERWLKGLKGVATKSSPENSKVVLQEDMIIPDQDGDMMTSSSTVSSSKIFYDTLNVKKRKYDELYIHQSRIC